MNRTLALGIAAALALCAGTSSALAQAGTAFTYQGQLKNAGSVVTTPTDMQFSLWTAASGGSQVGSTVTQNAVGVSSGLFNTIVDFGVNPYTSSQALYLQIAVRNPTGVGSFVPMGARPQLTPAPFSMATRGIKVDGGNNVIVGGGNTFQGLFVARGPNNGGAFRSFDNPVGTGPAAGTQLISEFTGNNAGAQVRFAAAVDSPNFFDIGQSATNDFVIQQNDVTRMMVRADGNVGIGTAAPGRMLHLKSNAVGMAFQDTGDADGPNARWTWDTQAFGVPGIALVRYDATGVANESRSLFVNNNGNVGIGLGNPAEKLDVAGNIRLPDVAVIGARQGDQVTGSLTIQAPGTVGSSGAGSLGGNLILRAGNGDASCGNVPPVGTSVNNNVQIFAGDNTFAGACGTVWNGNIQFFAGNGQPERMRIVGDNGQVLIGTTAASNAGFLLDVAGNIRCVGLTQTSTRDFKDNIVPLTGALDAVMKLNGVSYKWNRYAPDRVQGQSDIGFIADEVNRVLPDIVAKDEHGRPVGIDYGKITPVAVEAIKQLKADNDAKQARIDELAARLERLEAALEKLAHDDGK